MWCSARAHVSPSSAPYLHILYGRGSLSIQSNLESNRHVVEETHSVKYTTIIKTKAFLMLLWIFSYCYFKWIVLCCLVFIMVFCRKCGSTIFYASSYHELKIKHQHSSKYLPPCFLVSTEPIYFPVLIDIAPRWISSSSTSLFQRLVVDYGM